ERKLRRLRARGENDILGLNALRGSRDLYFHRLQIAAYAGKLPESLKVDDLIFCKESGDASSEPSHDVALALHHLRNVELDARDLDAVLRELVLDMVVMLARIEKRLGGNAPDIKAGSAQSGVFFHACGLEAQLR